MLSTAFRRAYSTSSLRPITLQTSSITFQGQKCTVSSSALEVSAADTEHAAGGSESADGRSGRKSTAATTVHTKQTLLRKSKLHKLATVIHKDKLRRDAFNSRPATSKAATATTAVTDVLSDKELEFMDLQRAAVKQKAPRNLLKLLDEFAAEKELTPVMTLAALKSMLRLNRTDLGLEIVEYWTKYCVAVAREDATNVGTEVVHQRVAVETAAAMVRLYCRNRQMDAAQTIADSVGVALKAHATADIRDGTAVTNDATDDTDTDADAAFTTAVSIPISTTASSECSEQLLPELALGYALADMPTQCIQALRIMQQHELRIDADKSRKILKQFLQIAKLGTVRRVLRLLLDLGGCDDSDSIQLITGAFLRQVDFVTGAVSLQTLPTAATAADDCPEVAFIGRSNVGKSSLINMICNRKGLAFTSKTPGKTSEFNYFDATGQVGVEKEKHRFYLVDLPGVGYAKAPRDLRSKWTTLLRDYAQSRQSLKVIFHLVDSRHGLMDADAECLDLLPELPHHLQYVILLTKADKQKNSDKVSAATMGIIDRIYREIAKRTDKVVPVILTSAESKKGGAEVLSLIFEAVERYNRTAK